MKLEGWICAILRFAVFSRTKTCDRQTDRQTPEDLMYHATDASIARAEKCCKNAKQSLIKAMPASEETELYSSLL